MIYTDNLFDLIPRKRKVGRRQQTINSKRIADASLLIAAKTGAATVADFIARFRFNIAQRITLHQRRNFTDLDNIAIFKFNFWRIFRLRQCQKILQQDWFAAIGRDNQKISCFLDKLNAIKGLNRQPDCFSGSNLNNNFCIGRLFRAHDFVTV